MSDKEGFKVPSLPVGRAKLAPSDEYVEAKEQESESQKVPEDSSQQEQTKPKAIREESSSSSTEQLPLSYVEPHWSSIPDGDYSLLIVKNGAEIGNLALNDKPYHTFGRLPNCDVTLEHPSISRYHALLQYRPEGTENQSGEDSSSGSPDAAGFYVYDLGSTHGTYLNKQRVRPRSYCRLRIGQMVKFGGSTRLFILEAGGSGQEAVEEEAEREIAALERHKEEVKKREQELAELEKEREAMEKEREKLGVTWGMVDDEIDLTSVGKADEIDLEREAYYRDDPKKALRKYFDKEDLELEFETVETGKKGVHCIRVSLPVQSAGGEMVVAEATLKGKKKEAVTQCALEACRLLDSYGMLRQASQGHKKKVKNWEEDDFYSSDEDSFLDRTGTIEKKRHSRMKKMGKAEDAAETFETLNKKLTEVTSSLQALEERLARAKEAETTSSKGDSLDVYMKSVKEKVDKGAMYDIKLQINKLKKEETKLRDLVKLAQPTELPALKQPENDEPPVASKPNPNKKQYGLTKLPVDRKQAYLREMAAKDRVPVKADNDDDECVVEYDSDDDEHGDNSSTKVDTTNTTSDTVHEEGNIISDTDNKTKDIVQDITDDKMSGQSANENNEVDCRETEDDQKVVSPKKRKMIGASLGPLRKRNRRRSSETTEEVTPTTQWSNDYDPDYASWLPPEDLELEFETVETGKKGVHCIRVSLPVQSAGGEMVVAEATLKGKKKEAVTQCALEACRLLDSYGMLRQASQGHKKKVKNWEEDDFYSSDEDSFLDRTGTIEKKRHSRMKKMGKAEDAVVTYETLNKKLSEVTSSLQALEERLARAKEAETISSKGDSLDVYMKSVKEKVDKGAMYDIKLQINKLKKEETKLRDLVKLAQPTELPALKQPENDKPPVASKPNPNKKQYGLTKLPVDRKQAYLREMAAKPVKADNDDDECVVEYDSDDDEHGDNSSTKVDTTNTTSDTIHEEEKIISDTDIMTKDMVQNVTDDKMSGQSVSENNEVDCRETEDDQKVVSPKKRKMIGASLGPLRKRNRRRSSETTEEVTPTTQWSNDYDPDYASWLPPEDQSGDGKTHLNAKYGY